MSSHETFFYVFSHLSLFSFRSYFDNEYSAVACRVINLQGGTVQDSLTESGGGRSALRIDTPNDRFAHFYILAGKFGLKEHVSLFLCLEIPDDQCA